MEKSKSFTPYQKLAIALLALTQFTVVLDFMVISPLGAFMMRSLSLKPTHFASVVSAYAISAGISGFATAGFADKFDRKKLLVFFYSGFILGTVFCGLSQSYFSLFLARIITGLFGGVMGSISMAIVTDLFSFHQRGRVMGFMQMGFGASQVLGIPIGLYLANHWGWQSTFWLVAAMAVIIAILLLLRLRPVNEHLAAQHERDPLDHLINTFWNSNYRIGFTSTALLSMGGFMMMPFGSAFAMNNLQIKPEHLSLLFLVGGVGSFVLMPLIGKLSDKVDKYKLFVTATIYMSIVITPYTNLGPEPLWFIMIFNVLIMTGIFGRIIPATALTTAIPEMQDRGAFMSINSSVQQIMGGFGAMFAGTIVRQTTSTSPLQHYNILGLVVVGISFIAAALMYRVDRMIKQRHQRQPVKQEEQLVATEGLPEI